MPRIRSSDSPQRLGLPLELWPDRDREAWFEAISPRFILDEQGRGAGWAPATQVGVRLAYGRWLGWLARGRKSRLRASMINRVSPEAVGAYIDDLRLTSSENSVSTNVAFLHMALLAMAPGSEWPWLRAIVARIVRKASPGRGKERRIVGSGVLGDFGMDLMAEVGTKIPSMCWPTATQYRDGLMIALLAARPLRRRNFISIEIGTHLVEHAGGPWLRFARSETKNREPIDQPFPSSLVPFLRTYVDEVRPYLCGRSANRDPRYAFRGPGDRLWVSKTGSALSAGTFFSMVVERTRRRFGHSVNPHLFRDCLATTLADADPGNLPLIPLILGHRAPHTSEGYYAHARGLAATEQFQQHVQRLRRQTPKSVLGKKALC